MIHGLFLFGDSFQPYGLHHYKNQRGNSCQKSPTIQEATKLKWTKLSLVDRDPNIRISLIPLDKSWHAGRHGLQECPTA